MEHTDAEVLTIRLDSGTEIAVTPTHPLFVEGKGWVPAGKLSAGSLLRADRGAARITALERTLSKQQVVNIEVGREHSYRVSEDAIWAHNQCTLDGSRATERAQVVLDWAESLGYDERALLTAA